MIVVLCCIILALSFISMGKIISLSLIIFSFWSSMNYFIATFKIIFLLSLPELFHSSLKIIGQTSLQSSYDIFSLEESHKGLLKAIYWPFKTNYC